MKKLSIDNCESCPCVDDGDAIRDEYYCDHQDAKRSADGKLICFNAIEGIPEWCPLSDDEE
jgi:hypothetical protein